MKFLVFVKAAVAGWSYSERMSVDQSLRFLTYRFLR
jgi:hypothetical protein